MRCRMIQKSPSRTAKYAAVFVLGEPLARGEFFIERQQQWYEVILSPVSLGAKSLGMVHVRRNITVAKDAQARSEIFNHLYTVLSHTNKAIADASSR
jgi:hypothetical protein